MVHSMAAKTVLKAVALRVGKMGDLMEQILVGSWASTRVSN